MIRVSPTVSIDPDELTETFIRASGPGGQNVNKVSSAVELRFDAANSPNLPERVKERLRRIGGHLITRHGVVIIHAEKYRTQKRNREDALDRLIDLLRDASSFARTRIPTRPTKASKRRRLDGKTRRGSLKAARQRPDISDS